MKRRIACFIVLTLAAITYMACSGKGDSTGGTNNDPQGETGIITGTAAVGAPLAGGIVYIKDAAGKMAQAEIKNDGTYSVEISEMNGPFILLAEGTYDSQSVALYSTIEEKGVANITPATNLIMTIALGDNPATAYPEAGMKQDGDEVADAPDASSLSDAKDKFNGMFEEVYTLFGVAEDFDVFSGSFQANSSGFDLILDRVKMVTADEMISGTMTTTVTISTIPNGSSTYEVFYKANAEAPVGTPSIVDNMANLAQSIEDVAAPVLTSLSHTPETINTTSSSTNINVAVSFTDDISGIYSLVVRLQKPSGGGISVPVFSYRNITWGNKNNGIISGSITIPQYSEQGEWKISEVRLEDNVGNQRTYNISQLNSMGIDTTFNVISVSDTQAPVLAGLSHTPETINTTSSSANINVAVSFTDDISGIYSLVVRLQKPSGGGISVPVFSYRNITWGNKNNGIISGSITIPQYSEQGEWKISEVYLEDNVGNQRTYNITQLNTMSIDTTFNVISVSDTQAPVLTGLTHTPETISTTSSSVNINVAVSFTDDISGIYSLVVRLQKPSGGGISVPVFSFRDITSGNKNNGTISGSIQIPQYSELGEWKISEVYLEDNVGNQRTYNITQLNSMGIDTTFINE